MNELKFLGIGSAFNTKLYNNSAYIKKGNDLLLIDCGSSIFSRIINENILNDVDNITVVITHMHPDHCGSLGDLIYYCYYQMKMHVNIVFPQINTMRSFLKLQGINPPMYKMIYSDYEYDLGYKIKFNFEFKFNNTSILISSIISNHVNEIQSYSYLIENDNELIFYSGDSNQINESIYEMFINNQISKIYQDVSLGDSGVHLNINDLIKYINYKNIERPNDIYCMHIDDEKIIEIAELNGLNVANIN